MSVSFDNIKLYNTDARSDIFFPFGTKKSSDEKSCRLNVFLHLLIPIYLRYKALYVRHLPSTEKLAHSVTKS